MARHTAKSHKIRKVEILVIQSKIYIELSSKNPLSKLSSLETEDLKNNPCILVINQTGQQDTACLFHTSNKPLLPE